MCSRAGWTSTASSRRSWAAPGASAEAAAARCTSPTSSLGILGANGIVGAGIPIARGQRAGASGSRAAAALPSSFFGDGAMAEGVLHETLNLAALWKLPLLFVCENNGWSEFSPTSRAVRGAGWTRWPRPSACRYTQASTATTCSRSPTRRRALVARSADGGGPRVLECKTHRVRGHFEGDPQKYRDADELQAVRKTRSAERAARGACAPRASPHRRSMRRPPRWRSASTRRSQAARADALPAFERRLGRRLHAAAQREAPAHDRDDVTWPGDQRRRCADSMAADPRVIVIGEDVGARRRLVQGHARPARRVRRRSACSTRRSPRRASSAPPSARR